MSYCLVVVDMQPGFAAAKYPLIENNCLREIKKAINDCADIVFLEYTHHGKTLPGLKLAVKGYHHAKFVAKTRDDGSAEVQNVVTENSFMISRFRVVGINTDWCVRATVEGLRNRFPNSSIEVIADACDSNDDHWGGLVNIRRIPQVDILHAP